MTALQPVKLLAALDGSVNSKRIIDYIGEAIPPAGKDLTLFRVINPIPETLLDLEPSTVSKRLEHVFSPSPRKLKEQAETFLFQCADHLARAGFERDDIHIKIKVVEDGTARDIALEAGNGYEAVFVGRKGASRLEDDIMGSTTSKLLFHLSEKPMLVIGQHSLTGKVLVALDGSEGSGRALDFTASLLAGSSAEVTLYHVVRQPPLAEYPQDPTLADEEADFLEDHVKQMEQLLKAERDRLAGQGLNGPRVRVKVDTDTYSRAGAIVTEARKGGYTTIVMGRRGFSEVMPHPMGRVCNKVLQMVHSRAVWIV